MIEENGVKRSWRRGKRRPLGDLVEDALKPIVEVLDDNLGTNFKGCGGCQRRKKWLNSITEEKENKE